MSNVNERAPRISVVLSAYNRKDYLLEAFDSLLNQSGDVTFDIVVLKNFPFPQIDNYKGKVSVQVFSNDKLTSGESFKKYFNYFTGDVIAFLEDDDVFTNEHLSRISQAFSDDKTLIFYHNSRFTIDNSGEVFQNQIFKEVDHKILFNTRTVNELKTLLTYYEIGSGNPSCMAICRNTLERWISSFSRIHYNPDNFLFFCALDNNGTILLDDQKLTFIRIHESSSNTTSSFSPHIKKEKTFRKNVVDGYLAMTEMASNPIAVKLSQYMFHRQKLTLNLYYRLNFKSFMESFTFLVKNKLWRDLKLIIPYIFFKPIVIYPALYYLYTIHKNAQAFFKQ